MIAHLDQRAYRLRCDAEALEATQRTVQVELSVAATWLLRDLLGLEGGLDAGAPLRPDMIRLNSVLEHRPPKPQGELPKPHVSGWSERVVKELRSR